MFQGWGTRHLLNYPNTWCSFLYGEKGNAGELGVEVDFLHERYEWAIPLSVKVLSCLWVSIFTQGGKRKVNHTWDSKGHKMLKIWPTHLYIQDKTTSPKFHMNKCISRCGLLSHCGFHYGMRFHVLTLPHFRNVMQVCMYMELAGLRLEFQDTGELSRFPIMYLRLFSVVTGVSSLHIIKSIAYSSMYSRVFGLPYYVQVNLYNAYMYKRYKDILVRKGQVKGKKVKMSIICLYPTYHEAHQEGKCIMESRK